MILGVGIDLCDIRRIEKTLERFGDRFVARVCTDVERSKAAKRPHYANEVAKFYAAKEACAKALGTGFRGGVFWSDIGVVSHESGKPLLVLTGGALDRLKSLTPKGMHPQLDISLTDEFPLAQAMVVISAIPDGQK
ncbi:MAG: holo-ACP synthase [Rhodospirillales bacterium]|nr:holo-ACP synthase [Rhodospirillales bacterium]MCW8862452.1 holo-ACP synthase [Rhodospirillales bacterium]MCW8952523.1 holo-ACP synthase [Rhodospirillales bacterium]MCW8970150.1 holo-ACP synthase [Rhodospirillales bacterium]MCW9002999.1 holo-ACP synthase [Rhodospirillales bacterium]